MKIFLFSMEDQRHHTQLSERLMAALISNDKAALKFNLRYIRIAVGGLFFFIKNANDYSLISCSVK